MDSHEPILPRPAWNDPNRLQERLRQVKMALAATALMGCGTPLDPRAVYGGPPIPLRSETPSPEPSKEPKQTPDDTRPRPPYGAAPPAEGVPQREPSTQKP